jgi:hypothetical protein
MNYKNKKHQKTQVKMFIHNVHSGGFKIKNKWFKKSPVGQIIFTSFAESLYIGLNGTRGIKVFKMYPFKIINFHLRFIIHRKPDGLRFYFQEYSLFSHIYLLKRCGSCEPVNHSKSDTGI